MVLFQQVLQVCFFSAVFVTVNSYVLFAANLEDFRNLAKKFISHDLAGKLTELVSESSLGYKKNRNEKKSSEEDTAVDVSRGRDRKMEYINDHDKSAEATIDQPRERHERIKTKYSTSDGMINGNGKTGPIEILLEDYKKQKSNVRKKPVDNDGLRNDKHNTFENDHLTNYNTKNIPTINHHKGNDRTQKSNAKKRPTENEFQNFEFQNEDRKKRPVINKLQNDQMQNSYTNKIPIQKEFENDDVQDDIKIIRAPENNYENDKTQVDNYDNVELATTTYATAKSKRYRTVKRLPASKSWYEQAQSYEKRKDAKHNQRPKQLLYEKEESKNIEQGNIEEESNRSVERNKRKEKYIFPIRESNYGKKTTTKLPEEREEFEPIKPKLVHKGDGMRINGQYENQRTTKKDDITENDNLIYEKVLLNKKKASDEENATVKKSLNYFDDEPLKPAQKAKKRPKSPSIMESPAETFKNRPESPSAIERQNHKQHDIFMDAEATDIYAKKIKKALDKPAGKKKHFVDYNEPEEEEPKEIQMESVKARTESLIFNSEENNDAVSSSYFMKGTGVPTRERYKMSTPDYYKKLPRIVEKYDFNEPIPEADREREVFNDKKLAVLEPARVNKKVKQQQESVRKIMDEIGWSS